MKKFGFGKKSEGDDDQNRSALFGKKGGSRAPSSANPYAQSQPADDPYMNNDNNKYANVTPYQQARSGLPSGPRPGGLPSGPGPRSGYSSPALNRNTSNSSSGTAPPPYTDAQPSTGYGAERYGTASGYGKGTYSSSAGNSAAAGRTGGYGGLGRTDTDDSDLNRDALFSGARQRNELRQTNNSTPGGAYGDSTSGAADSGNKYQGYGERRELTEEEKEEEAYRDTKREIHDTTKASLNTTQNSLRLLNEATDTGLATYARLGAQDTATESHRTAEAQTKKLKSLNRSMFAVHVKNPFGQRARTAEEEAKMLAQNQSDREIREATRRERFGQNQRMEQTFAGFDKSEAPSSFANRNDRSKYTLEDDSDEEGAAELDAANEQIERDLEAMSVGVSKLKRIGQAMGDELDHGNKLIDGIGKKTDPLDDQLRVTNARINRIR